MGWGCAGSGWVVGIVLHCIRAFLGGCRVGVAFGYWLDEIMDNLRENKRGCIEDIVGIIYGL